MPMAERGCLRPKVCLPQKQLGQETVLLRVELRQPPKRAMLGARAVQRGQGDPAPTLHPMRFGRSRMNNTSDNGVPAMSVLGLSMTVLAALLAAGENQSGTEPGLVWVFFNGSNLSRPGDRGVDPQVNLDTGTAINDYSRLWFGAVTAPIKGEVTFTAEADNGCRVWILNTRIIDGWAENSPRQGAFSFEDAGQSVPIRVEFFQNGGTAHMRLFWEWPGHDRELVPAAAFTHTAPDLEEAAALAGKPARSAENVPISHDYACRYVPGQQTPPTQPIHLAKGPHLFIDDYLIADSNNVQRVVNVPQRDPGIPNPIVTGKEDGCFQPYMTILQDPGTGRFRIWYGGRAGDSMGQSHINYMESTDGVHWERPMRTLRDPGPIQFGVSVVDRGPGYAVASQRYAVSWWMDGGLQIAASPDGFEWTPIRTGPVIYHNHDITGLYFDPRFERYVATISTYREGDTWSGNRRITMHSFSTNLVDWTTPHYILLPDDSLEPGETQFYAMDGYLRQGDLLIGMVKVLRDDLKADDPPDPPDAYGVGYTSLAWSRDGESWIRDTTHFFDRDPQKGAWDHAHAWIDEQVPVGDDVYLYYGGYARGHKVNRFEERQIGLVKIKRDRYAAREAGPEPGLVRTPLLILEGDGITLNADAQAGEIRVQAVGEDGQPLPGFTFAECKPIASDALDANVVWTRPLSEIVSKPLRLEFRLQNARLYAFAISQFRGHNTQL